MKVGDLVVHNGRQPEQHRCGEVGIVVVSAVVGYPIVHWFSISARGFTNPSFLEAICK